MRRRWGVAAAVVALAGVVRALARRRLAVDRAVAEARIVRLGERRYYVNMRGRSAEKPLLLFLHGGPAVPLAPFLHVFQLPLERDFICVHWDQFASGKSYGLNPASEPITFDETLADVSSMVEWLCRHFNRDRLILCGFSWGSIPGLAYARQCPERLLVYVGVGQCINHRAELRELVQEATASARSDGDTAAVQRLDRFAAALDADARLAARFLHPERIAERWLPSPRQLPFWRQLLFFASSPYYSLWDGRHFLAAQLFHQRNLLHYMTRFYDADATGHRFRCPLVFLSGAADSIIPPRLISAYAGRLEAPYVHMRTLHGVGHNIFLEAPGRSIAALRTEIHHALQYSERKDS